MSGPHGQSAAQPDGIWAPEGPGPEAPASPLLPESLTLSDSLTLPVSLMPADSHSPHDGAWSLDDQLAQWRHYLERRPGIAPADVDELEDHLLGQVEGLRTLGLSEEEAFLVAVRRLGAQDELARDFAREHSERLWKQLVVGAEPTDRAGLWPMLGFAAAAGLAVMLPLKVTGALTQSTVPFVPLTLAVVGLAAVLAGYFWWLRRPPVRAVVVATVVAVAAVLLARLLYPFGGRSSADTQALLLVHAPIGLGVLLGASYLGRAWRDVHRWLDYVRFVGEWLIYYALIALGGGVLIALTGGIFGLVGLKATEVLAEWVLPLGIGGAAVVAAWLVEAKQSVVENMAPVLTWVFTPLFTLVTLAFLGAVVVTGRLVDLDRGALIIIDLVLVAVLGLVLFSVSARPTDRPVGSFDRMQLVLVFVALVIDVLALVAMAGRIGEFGASPNKAAALGENLVLAVSLAGSGWLYLGFVRGRRQLAELVAWQCRSLWVIGVWAGVVALLFPPLFGFR